MSLKLALALAGVFVAAALVAGGITHEVTKPSPCVAPVVITNSDFQSLSKATDDWLAKDIAPGIKHPADVGWTVDAILVEKPGHVVARIVVARVVQTVFGPAPIEAIATYKITIDQSCAAGGWKIVSAVKIKSGPSA